MLSNFILPDFLISFFLTSFFLTSSLLTSSFTIFLATTQPMTKPAKPGYDKLKVADNTLDNQRCAPLCSVFCLRRHDMVRRHGVAGDGRSMRTVRPQHLPMVGTAQTSQ